MSCPIAYDRAMTLARAFAVIASGWAGTVLAAPQDCPMIRPPGLSPAQVEAVVLSHLSETIGVSKEALNRLKSFDELDPSSDREMHFAYFVVRVSEDLGIDDAAAFYEIAKTRHDGRMSALAVQEYLDASRTAYSKGKDEPPPSILEGASYRLGRKMFVRAPSPARGWYLVACGHAKIAFQRADADGGVSTAYVTTLSLPPFVNEAAFKAYAREAVSGLEAQFGAFKSIDVEATALPRPCTEFRAIGAAIRFAARGRTCYEDSHSTYGYAAYFMRTGPVSAEEVFAEAGGFVDAVLGVTR
jgi:hypothetical protein